MEATNHVAMQLMEEWDEFLKHDRRMFLKSATNRRQKISVWQGSLLPHLYGAGGMDNDGDKKGG